MPGNDLARQIKEHLTARQVVELYGFHPDRGGYIQCPFHAGDNHGSLKVYDGDKSGWHCFGCGAGGSVIDFVAMVGSTFTLTVRVMLKVKQNYDDVETLLNRIVPENLVLDLSLMYNQHQTLAAFTHAQLAAYTHYFLRNEVLPHGNN